MVFDVNDKQILLREDDKMSDQSEPLASFLRTLDTLRPRMLEKQNGQIIYADDQFVNQELIKMNISEINI